MTQINKGSWDANPAPGYRKFPDHRISVRPFKGTVHIRFEGETIAMSKEAYMVEENDHKPVFYIPSQDVVADFLVDSFHVTRCPFKGKARYWNLKVRDHEIDNAIWSYEMPYDEAIELAGLMAFYDTKVKIEVTPEK